MTRTAPSELDHLDLLLPRRPGHALLVEWRGDDPDPDAEYLSFDDSHVDHSANLYSWGVRTREGVLTWSDGLIHDPATSRAKSAEAILASGPPGRRWSAPDVAREMVNLFGLTIEEMFGLTIEDTLDEARAGLTWAAHDPASRVRELPRNEVGATVEEPTFVYVGGDIGGGGEPSPNSGPEPQRTSDPFGL